MNRGIRRQFRRPQGTPFLIGDYFSGLLEGLKMKNTTALTLALFMAVSSAAEAGELVIQVGFGPGGIYDGAARLVADHIGRHIDGDTTVVVENVPGAGSLKLARMMMESPVTDGSVIATIGAGLALVPILDPQNDAFDPRKVHYLASLSSGMTYCVTTKESDIETLDAFLTQPFKVGASGKDSSTYTHPAAIRKALGAKFDIVTGFAGANEINLAMARGDLQGRCCATQA